MKTIEVRKERPEEPPQVAFDRVARKVRALFGFGYRVKQPCRRSVAPGEFTVEKLPLAAGWKLTVEPLGADTLEAVDAA